MLSAFKRASMRKQILISLMLAMVILMGIAGTISYFVALNQADEIFSARLATSARVLDALLSRSVEDASVEIPLVISLPKELSETNDDDSTPLGHPYETKLAFQLWHADGHLLVRSEFAPLYRLGPFKEGFSETSSMGHDWHVFTLKSNDVWVEVAEEVGLRGEIANNVGVYSSSPFFICSAVLFLLVNLIVIVGFRPLKQLAWVIEHRDPKDNSAILLTKTPKEILPVVQALNALFDRVSQVLARERRFTDSAAHELRTPLAALSLHAENVSSATTEEERAISLAQLMTGLSRTKHLVEQMLTYSRISSDTHGETLSEINLGEELNYLVTRQRTVLEESGLQIVLNLPLKPLHIPARRGLLEILLRNLLDNACKYTAQMDQPVLLNLFISSEGQPVLVVSNTALPIPAEHVDRLFEPYYRLPSAKQKGNGLGLAMAQDIAILHGWRLFLQQKRNEDRIELIVVFSP